MGKGLRMQGEKTGNPRATSLPKSGRIPGKGRLRKRHYVIKSK